MAAAPPQPYPPLQTGHLIGALGGIGVLCGLAALVLMICTMTLDLPGAPMAFAAILGSVFGISAMVVWCTRQVIRHQQSCYEANRAASAAEIEQALKKVHKDVDRLKAQWRRTEVARTHTALFEGESRLHLIDGGTNGMG